jgi:hypothetical protein
LTWWHGFDVGEPFGTPRPGSQAFEYYRCLTAITHTARVMVAMDKEAGRELHARTPEADAPVSSAEWLDVG